VRGRAFQLLALGLPLVRSNGMHSVAWKLEPHKTLRFGEVQLQVHRVTHITWIDLGYGVPL
jgi:hypothetical protein